MLLATLPLPGTKRKSLFFWGKILRMSLDDILCVTVLVGPRSVDVLGWGDKGRIQGVCVFGTFLRKKSNLKEKAMEEL